MEKHESFAAALAAAQAEMTDPQRTKVGTVRGRTNYKYAGLDDLLRTIRPVLGKHGLSVTQAVQLDGDGQRVSLVTTLLHEKGQAVSQYPLRFNGDPQACGSELTYARRYSLEALVGVAASDDDDASAAKDAKPEVRKTEALPPEGTKDAPKAPPEGTKAAPKALLAKHHESWDGARVAFCAKLGELGVKYDQAADMCKELKRPRPSGMDNAQRGALLKYLGTEAGQATLAAATQPESVPADPAAAV